MLAALGSAQGWAVAVLAGLVLVGTASATALLARTAAGDMYPPERRARGIALVLFGSVFGAILGPAVFSPLLAGRDLDGDALSTLWIAASGFMIVGLAIVLTVRPDPKRIAELLAQARRGARAAAAAPAGDHGSRRLRCASCCAARASIPALVAAQASFAVMVAVMTLTGAVIVDHHHHAADNVFPIIGAHVIGMFGLIIVVGDIVDARRAHARARGRAAAHGGVDDQPAVDHRRGGLGGGAVRARPGLELLVRRGHRRAVGHAPRPPSAASCWASTTCSPG